jgi:protein-tyrosine phosphatase
MRFFFFLTGMAVLLLAHAWFHGGWHWLLAWPGLSFAGVALAYAGPGPRWLGKRPDGTIAGWAIALWLPYFALTWMTWVLLRRTSRQAACHEVAPGLWVGRRLAAAEMPPGIDLVVDLTAEFHETTAVRRGRRYLCLPTLDGLVPAEPGLSAIVAEAAQWPGCTLIHCGAGYGRSAMVTACVLLRKGLVATPAEAERMLCTARPGVCLSSAQRAQVESHLRQATTSIK